jgi:hypothetical protein
MRLKKFRVFPVIKVSPSALTLMNEYLIKIEFFSVEDKTHSYGLPKK